MTFLIGIMTGMALGLCLLIFVLGLWAFVYGPWRNR